MLMLQLLLPGVKVRPFLFLNHHLRWVDQGLGDACPVSRFSTDRLTLNHGHQHYGPAPITISSKGSLLFFLLHRESGCDARRSCAVTRLFTVANIRRAWYFVKYLYYLIYYHMNKNLFRIEKYYERFSNPSHGKSCGCCVTRLLLCDHSTALD